MAPIKVGILGAAGETGNSIINGLIEAGICEIIALVRPASLSKPANQRLEELGIVLRHCDLNGSHDSLVTTLQDIKVLICAIGPLEQLAQIPLATAAAAAGVKRFLPCAFVPVVPVGGVHVLRDLKELVYNHVKQLRLPYTFLDVGWWYQASLPPLPSGRIDYALTIPRKVIAGDGTVPSALTEVKDIGRYVAQVIVDERTLNRMVLVYNEMWSQNQIYKLLEDLSGETIPRTYISEAELQADIDEIDAKYGKDAAMNALSSKGAGGPEIDFATFLPKFSKQYLISWGVKGHNTPEYAKYLGYLTSKELYPSFEYTRYEDYVQTVLDGKAAVIYQEMRDKIRTASK